MRKIPVLCKLSLLVLATSLCFAETPDLAPTLTAYGFLEAGEIMKGLAIGRTLDHKWLERTVIGIGLKTNLNEHARVSVCGEGEIAFSYLYHESYQALSSFATRQPRFGYYVTEGQGEYLFGDTAQPFLKISAGYFPYKYNEDVRNLGEFLFRTITYPNYIDNAFDKPFARLLGFKFGSTLFGGLTSDFLLTSETKNYPLEDFSLSYIGAYSYKKIFDVGWGVNFDRIFPVDDSKTTPKVGGNGDANIYLKNIVSIKAADGTTDSIVSADTGYFSFAGTKVMLRFALDFKPLLAGIGVPVDLFGTEDLRLYGEGVILGTEDFPSLISRNNQYPLYSKMSERIPKMVGFNVPFFELLDVAALEVEWNPSRYPNSYEQIFRGGLPQPAFANSPLFDHEKISWSVYLKKQVLDVFTIKIQCARDHLHPLNLNIERPETYDVLPKPGNWWWMAKVEYGF